MSKIAPDVAVYCWPLLWSFTQVGPVEGPGSLAPGSADVRTAVLTFPFLVNVLSLFFMKQLFPLYDTSMHPSVESQAAMHRSSVLVVALLRSPP